VQFDADTALSVRETIAGLGHAIELRAYRSSGVLHLDWWYDARRLRRETVEGLVQNFPVTLTTLIHEAIAAAQEDGEMDSATASLGLVDLSAGDFG
jgi:phthiocerol/phenolphthiocerol synthesis type-I polyketide synthase E